jgi:outer membrane protein assembly factor BamE (lipoprotein component of BamABCDE complex)
MKTNIRLALLFIMAAFAAGCMSTGHELDQSKVAQIKKGVTTKPQVRELLGAPEQVAIGDDGIEVWLYTYTRMSSEAQNYIPIVGGFVSGYNTQNQITKVIFTPDGIVKSVFTSYGGDRADANLSAGSTPDVAPSK